MEFLFEYGLFLAKSATVVAAFIFVAGSIFTLSMRHRGHGNEEIQITKLNDKYDHMRHALESAILSKDAMKKTRKEEKKAKKQARKTPDEARKRVFVMNFDGDIRGSHVVNLREEITAVLTIADKSDEIVIKVESGGGMVHAYGLAASQLDRIRGKEIPLTVCVDKVAASGGYLMACVANRVVAAPFAIIGSIGVVTQIPNFNKVLRKHDIEYEQITAGEYKRTLTMFGENTDRDRAKMREDVEETHGLFKDFVSAHRPDLDIEQVATGEHWLGTRARELGLVDELCTSDDLLLAASDDCDILEISYKAKQNVLQKLTGAATRLMSTFRQQSAESPPHLLV